MKVSAALSNTKASPSNLTIKERKAVMSLSKDQNITIQPADKGSCTVVLNAVEYHARVTILLSDTNTYETLRRNPPVDTRKRP